MPTFISKEYSKLDLAQDETQQCILKYIKGSDLFTCVLAHVLDFLLHSEAILDVQEILRLQCTALNPQEGSRKRKLFF